MIKRYDFEYEEIFCGELPDLLKIERPDGEYVEYNDVVDLIKKCIWDQTIDNIRLNLAEEFGIKFDTTNKKRRFKLLDAKFGHIDYTGYILEYVCDHHYIPNYIILLQPENRGTLCIDTSKVEEVF